MNPAVPVGVESRPSEARGVIAEVAPVAAVQEGPPRCGGTHHCHSSCHKVTIHAQCFFSFSEIAKFPGKKTGNFQIRVVKKREISGVLFCPGFSRETSLMSTQMNCYAGQCRIWDRKKNRKWPGFCFVRFFFLGFLVLCLRMSTLSRTYCTTRYTLLQLTRILSNTEVNRLRGGKKGPFLPPPQHFLNIRLLLLATKSGK